MSNREASRVQGARPLVAGYYGFGNFGDELLAEAVIASLLRCGVSRGGITVLTNDPAGYREKFGTGAVNRWDMKEVWRALGGSTALLLGGGGLFQDVSSVRSCVYYWGLVRMAELRGVASWAIGQSVGPFSTRAGRWLARDALKRCRAVHVRGEASLSLCKSWGLSPEPGHDLVLSLGAVGPEPHKPFGRVTSGSSRWLLAQDLLPNQREGQDVGTPAGLPGAGAMPLLLVNFRECAGGLPERFAEAVSAYAHASGREVVGVALSEDDERLTRRLADGGKLPLSRVERVTAFDDALRVFAGAEAAAGMRLHFAVLAAMAGVPLAAVPYDPKVAEFAAECGVPLWRGGPLPEPRRPRLPCSAESVRAECDALCRRALRLPAAT